MPDAKSYTGSCHCGAVRFTAKADLRRAITCNCSMCRRAGTILAFLPAADFHLETSEDALTDYQFNKKVIHHLFCKTCGIKAFGRGKEPDGRDMVAVNVRCLDGVDLDAVKPVAFDGASL